MNNRQQRSLRGGLIVVIAVTSVLLIAGAWAAPGWTVAGSLLATAFVVLVGGGWMIYLAASAPDGD